MTEVGRLDTTEARREDPDAHRLCRSCGDCRLLKHDEFRTIPLPRCAGSRQKQTSSPASRFTT